MKTGRVAVVGRSIHMAGLAASLKTNPVLQVVRVNPDSPTARRAIDELVPDVIILDLVEPHPDLTMALLRERPGLLLLGMDPSRDEMLVLSSQPARAQSMQDLLRVVNPCAAVSRPTTRVPDLARLRQFTSNALARIPTRRRQFSLALAGIIVCVVLALGLSLAGSNTNAPLVGTAIGSGSGSSIVMFAAGIVLGGAGIALLLHCNRQKKDIG